MHSLFFLPLRKNPLIQTNNYCRVNCKTTQYFLERGVSNSMFFICIILYIHICYYIVLYYSTTKATSKSVQHIMLICLTTTVCIFLGTSLMIDNVEILANSMHISFSNGNVIVWIINILCLVEALFYIWFFKNRMVNSEFMWILYIYAALCVEMIFKHLQEPVTNRRSLTTLCGQIQNLHLLETHAGTQRTPTNCHSWGFSLCFYSSKSGFYKTGFFAQE